VKNLTDQQLAKRDSSPEFILSEAEGAQNGNNVQKVLHFYLGQRCKYH
jgi:hypothetical protein